jgi:hypothetical protein
MDVVVELVRQLGAVVVTGIKHDHGQQRHRPTVRSCGRRAQAAGQQRGFVVGRNDDYRLLESDPPAMVGR